MAALISNDRDRNLWVADLTTGELSIAAKAAEREIMDISVSGPKVAWIDGRFDGNTSAAPCGSQGGITWHARLTNITTGDTAEVAAGRQTDVVGLCSADTPRVAVDGDLMAYAAESATSDNPHGWQITVVDVATGDVVRTIQTQHGVFDLALDGGDVAYVDGAYPKNGDFDPTQTWVRLSTVSDPHPILIAADSDSLSFAEGRLAWDTCDDSGCRTMTTTTAALEPRAIGGSSWPGPAAVANSVFVVQEDHINAWNSQTDGTTSLPVGGTRAPDVVGARDGWLVWADTVVVNGELVQSISGLPLDQLP